MKKLIVKYINIRQLYLKEFENMISNDLSKKTGTNRTLLAMTNCDTFYTFFAFVVSLFKEKYNENSIDMFLFTKY